MWVPFAFTLLITIIGVSYAFLHHKKMTVTALILFIACLNVMYNLRKMDSMSARLRLIELQQEQTTVETVASLTNGLYRVSAVAISPAGGYLAVLQPTVIIHVNPEARVVAATNVGNYPRLVASKWPLTAPGQTGFTGFAEVLSDDAGTQIRDYKPFAYMVQEPK